MHNVDRVYTTPKALSQQLVGFLSVPSSSELEREIIMYRSLELDQIVRASGHNFIDYVDLYVAGNAVDNSVLLERPKQN